MTSRIAVLLCILTGLAVFQFQGYRYGEKIAVMERENNKALLQSSEKARTIEHKAQKNLSDVAGADNARRTEIKIVTEYVDREVVKYVETDPAAGSCTFSDNWVRAYDGGARMPSSARTKPFMDDPAAAITDIEVLSVSQSQFKTYAEVSANLAALQAYITDVVLPACGPPR